MGISARRQWLLASVCAAAVLGAQAQARAQCSSTACGTVPLDLGSLGGISIGHGVSADGGVVVGSGLIGGSDHAFRWTAAGGMQDIQSGGFTDSLASGVSADGGVAVGSGSIGGSVHAFRWTDTGGSGTMTDIHDLSLFSNSYAYGVSADGGVVVGYGSIGGSAHAFRWTDTGGSGTMTEIQGGGFTSSIAYGVSADGGVVVGYGSIGGGFHAFRWTDTGGSGTMTDIHGGVFTGSLAYGVNADGGVVVGYGAVGGSNHAFRWTDTGGSGTMTDIHGGGFSESYANGVSADGGVVVGYGSNGGFATRAVRWTQATGMADLNTLLTNAGVNMSGITLTAAVDVSANGQFITGYGNFSGNTRAYLVRYQDGTTGLTTADSLRDSVTGLAQAQGGVMAQHHGIAAPLLGADRPIGLGTEAGIFAAVGSATGGGYARYGSASGFAVLGGFAYTRENYARAELKDNITAAAAVQYVHNTESWWRPFVEAGGWIAPNSRMDFARSYVNGAGTATGRGATRGDLSYSYGRAGILLAHTQESQIALSAEIGHERLKLDAYAEPDGMANPFPAALSAGTDRMNVFKARAQASRSFDARIDATIYGAFAHGFDRRSDVVAYVVPFGAIAPSLERHLDWFEYGARVGYRLTEAMTLDVFANGVSGGDGIGTRVHGGAGLRMRF
jgi:probable HAF family extracellular repeat protein